MNPTLPKNGIVCYDISGEDLCRGTRVCTRQRESKKKINSYSVINVSESLEIRTEKIKFRKFVKTFGAKLYIKCMVFLVRKFTC